MNMELIYKNEYGSCYEILDAPNPNCKFQLIINTVGIFMTKNDLQNLLNLVKKSSDPCYCEECEGNKSDKIWCKSSLLDVCLKVEDPWILQRIEDLITGTFFMMNVDNSFGKSLR